LIIVHFCLQQLLFIVFNFEKTGLKDHLFQLDIADLNVMETINLKEIEDIEDRCISNLFCRNARIISNLIRYFVLFNCDVTNIDVTHIIQSTRSKEFIVDEFRIG